MDNAYARRHVTRILSGGIDIYDTELCRSPYEDNIRASSSAYLYHHCRLADFDFCHCYCIIYGETSILTIACIYNYTVCLSAFTIQQWWPASQLVLVRLYVSTMIFKKNLPYCVGNMSLLSPIAKHKKSWLQCNLPSW